MSPRPCCLPICKSHILVPFLPHSATPKCSFTTPQLTSLLSSLSPPVSSPFPRVSLNFLVCQTFIFLGGLAHGHFLQEALYPCPLAEELAALCLAARWFPTASLLCTSGRLGFTQSRANLPGTSGPVPHTPTLAGSVLSAQHWAAQVSRERNDQEKSLK